MIYLDANATARVRPEVGAAFEQLFCQAAPSGNPSSVHAAGRSARAVLRKSRHAILKLIGVEDPAKATLVFTSGGTEACNLMLQSLLGTEQDVIRYPQHIVSSSIEHPAVLETLKQLEKFGWQISWVDPAADGRVSVQSICDAVLPNTSLVTLMLANNETGIVQPVEATARALRANGYNGSIVSDCIQALGKMHFDAPSLFASGVDAIALSGHKIGAPAGIGAVVFAVADSSRCAELHARIFGGPQEGGVRGGTENVFGACAFGAAADALRVELDELLLQRSRLRYSLWEMLDNYADPAVNISGNGSDVLSNTLCVRFPGCRGDDLVVALDLLGVCASTGSACASGKQGTSHVARAMGLSETESRELLRLSIDWDTTEEQIREAAKRIAHAVLQMRSNMLSGAV